MQQKATHLNLIKLMKKRDDRERFVESKERDV